MSESQTLKTMVHETAHSMLHDKEINKDILAPAKDRNTKEVEAEGIAFTVCSRLGMNILVKKVSTNIDNISQLK